MPKPSSQLSVIYSGGPGNTAPAMSLGGQASTAAGKYVLSQEVTMPALPGVTVRYVYGAPLGAGTLTYHHPANYLSWSPATGPTFSTVGLTASGGYALGDDAFATFMQADISLGLLPTSTTSVSLSIADKQDSVFESPNGTDLNNGATHHVILYALNESATTLYNTRIAVTQSTPISEVTIAGLFPPSSLFQTTRPAAARMFRGYSGWGKPAMQYFEDGAYPEHLTTPLFGSTQMFYTDKARGQSSDGVSIDLAPVISNPYDPGGVLSGYAWSDYIDIPAILPNRMVSFALRRVIPADTDTYSAEYVTLNLTLSI